MDIEHIVPAHFLLHLADSLHKRQGLNIAHSAADFGDNHIRTVISCHIIDTLLDFVGDVRNNLHGLAQIIPATLLVQHVPINLAGSYVGTLGQADVNKTLIMPQVQVSFRTIIGNEHLAMLIRAHGTRVNVDIRVKLLNSDLDTAIFQQASQGSCRDALAQR